MSRYKPECACAGRDAVDFEFRVVSVVASGLVSLGMLRRQGGLCLEAERYMSLTAITSLVMGMSMPVKTYTTMEELLAARPNEEEFELILETLVDEVRQRRAEMDAVKEMVENGQSKTN